ncbi:MAG: homoserine kinase [Ignavibacteria bacterium]|nr:homoserine kinase [Ignavibacteria bacterium]MBI3765293.1 homoserine kinase [Ignavibacteriales bacterium]
MKPKRVKVYAPASISNLGPGFDVLGIAIDQPGDIVIAHRIREQGLTFTVVDTSRTVPADARSNVAAHVASLMMKECDPPFGIQLELHKQMPVGSGLGSSAASSVAAAVAVNALLPKPLKRNELLRFVVDGERKASGSPHADNATPSLLGGAWLIRSYNPLDVISIPIRNTLMWVVVHPHLMVQTREARTILPKSIPLTHAIRQWGNVSGLTAGLIAGDAGLIGKCMEDIIIEPVRARLIPGFSDVKRAALSSGAVACSISGSGPSMFAVTTSLKSARSIAAAMEKQFTEKARVGCDVYISRVNMEGAIILEMNTK